MGLYDFTTKEILNKIFRTSGGDAVGVASGTTQERLAAALDSSNNRLNVELEGGIVNGDLTVLGDNTNGMVMVNIPCSSVGMTDNTNTIMTTLTINNYSPVKEYVWHTAIIWEGLLVAYPGDPTSPHCAAQFYKASVSKVKSIISDTSTVDVQEDEAIEPGDVTTSGGDIRCYQCSINADNPDHETMTFEINLNASGSEVGTSTLTAFGMMKVFHLCRNLTDGTFENVDITFP